MAQGAEVAAFFDGAICVECEDAWARPWRLRHEDRELYAPQLAAMASCAAVRLLLCSEARRFCVVAAASTPEGVDEEALKKAGGYPLEYELYIDGAFFAMKQLGATKGEHTVLFEDLPEGRKLLELWLPAAISLKVYSLDAGDQAIERPLADSRPVWLCHGSSITHGGPVGCRPSRTWAATCARLADVRLTNLGFGGECMLDPAAARVIRDTPCDCITLKVGINITCMAALTARSFPAALIGFIQTVRDGHPDTPLVVVSAIWFRPLESNRPVSAPQFLTLAQAREHVKRVVEMLRRRGDEKLFYRDGLELLGEPEEHLLYDRIHPGAEGHLLMGTRFAGLEFGPEGRLLPGRSEADPLAPPAPPAGTAALKALMGTYICEVPGGGRCLIKIGESKGGDFVAESNRKDWPPSILDARDDLVFLRTSPGTWGQIKSSEEGKVIAFCNGIVWRKADERLKGIGKGGGYGQ